METAVDDLFKHHKPKDDQATRYENIRNAGKELYLLIDASCPVSSEKDIAFERLRESIMWANAAIAIHE